MKRVITDECSGSWPNYLRQDVSTARVFDCPCEAVSLANVSDCLKSEIPQDISHPDLTKEPFSPWVPEEPAHRRHPLRSRPGLQELGPGAPDWSSGQRQGSAHRYARPTAAPHSVAALWSLRQRNTARRLAPAAAPVLPASSLTHGRPRRQLGPASRAEAVRAHAGARRGRATPKALARPQASLLRALAHGRAHARALRASFGAPAGQRRLPVGCRAAVRRPAARPPRPARQHSLSACSPS